MAEFQKKVRKNTRSKTKCFFGCFGFSGEDVDSGSRKKSCWFSWSKFRMKRPPTKTVPVESPGISNKPTENSIEARAPKAKSDKLVTSKRQNPDTSRKPQSQIPAQKSDQDIMETPQQTRYGPEQITVQSVLEDRSRHFDSAKDDTCQERMMSFRWKRHCKKTVSSQPGSPISKFNSGPIGAVISHSTSVPARKTREKPRGNATVHPPETSSKSVGKFDTVVGMSIITLTLIIMILWGRLCAVLCMSAWFYFIPRLRTAAVETNSSPGVIGLEEYKKKVVLEGFLERNHRSNIGCSS